MGTPEIYARNGRNIFRQRFLERELSDHPLADQAFETLLENISCVKHPFKRVLLLGWPGQENLKKFQSCFPELSAVIYDVAVPSFMQNKFPAFSFVCGDLDALPFCANAFDLVINFMTLHLVNDLPGVLRQLNVFLVPDGLFVSVCFAGDTLHNFQRSWVLCEEKLTGGIIPRFSPQVPVHQGAMLMQRAGFQVSLCHVQRQILVYAGVLDFLKDLHQYGQWAPLIQGEQGLKKTKFLQSIICKLGAKFLGDLEIPVELIYLSGRAPHPHQQRPSLPGSAQASLARL